ncbi:MATE family efflux transporter [Qingshengfaniella alkalisoli]|uniref:MATE family efflux transporter n=1 Tax=Qingshengfaniella alkalisoli TaxID=2599296 RepID=A0A5B8IQN3_9RHOB|nr:MATE family efflux transporter [Qingshengfaniella alkalisoli]QDY68552.1 MATE family efflux transporter [Qingshengfaniella alkalisoli]
MVDVAAGQPLTHRRVLKIAVPIVVSGATVPILGAVDTGVVGQLGDPVPIGAVGIGAVILTAIYWIFGFLRMGTTGMTAQAQGAADHEEVSALLVRALMIAFGAGVLLIVAQSLLFTGAFLISPASAEVEASARDYMQLRIFSAPAAIAIFGVTGWLIALERTRAVLAVQLWMNGMNIALDLWFVLGLDMGVRGVAFATFLSEWSGLVVGLWFCRDGLRGGAWRNWARVLDRERLVRMAVMNIDILIRSVLLLTIMLSFVFLAADFGDVPLAANQILLQFINITAYALDGFAFAAEALIGQALGARSLHALRRAAVMTSIWGAVIAVCLALTFGMAGPAIIDLMTTAPEVRLEAREYLPYMILTPLLGLPSWMLDGFFIGATRTRDMRNMMIVTILIYVVAVAILVPLFQNHGLWMAFLVSYVARATTLAAKYPALERGVAQN